MKRMMSSSAQPPTKPEMAPKMAAEMNAKFAEEMKEEFETEKARNPQSNITPEYAMQLLEERINQFMKGLKSQTNQAD